MPVASGVQAVGTAASSINTTDVMPFALHVHNNDNTDAIYIGGPGVTAATGMRLEKLERAVLQMGPADRVYVVSTKTGHSISWLKITKAA